MSSLDAARADFDALRIRRERVARLCESHLRALQRFHTGPDITKLASEPVELQAFELHPTEGKVGGSARLSISSAATCVRSLFTSPDVGDNTRFMPILTELNTRYIGKKLTTRGLQHGNPYTLGQLLPTLRQMVDAAEPPALVPWGLGQLEASLQNGGVCIEEFPAHGYLTFWALVSMETWDALTQAASSRALDWSLSELYRQVALLAANDDEGDVYQLGYNLLIQRRFRTAALKDSVLRTGLRLIFDAQLRSGLWEKKSRCSATGTRVMHTHSPSNFSRLSFTRSTAPTTS